MKLSRELTPAESEILFDDGYGAVDEIEEWLSNELSSIGSVTCIPEGDRISQIVVRYAKRNAEGAQEKLDKTLLQLLRLINGRPMIYRSSRLPE